MLWQRGTGRSSVFVVAVMWQGDVTVWVPSPMHSVSSLVPPAGGMALEVCWWELMFGKSYFFVDPHLWGVDF